MIHAETAASILRITLALLKRVHFTVNGIRLKLTSLKVTVKSIVRMGIREWQLRERATAKSTADCCQSVLIPFWHDDSTVDSTNIENEIDGAA